MRHYVLGEFLQRFERFFVRQAAKINLKNWIVEPVIRDGAFQALNTSFRGAEDDTIAAVQVLIRGVAERRESPPLYSR